MSALDPSFLTIPISHRGYHDRSEGRIENSPSAFRAALDSGYGIELDVQMSADGQAMVFHDDELDRLTEANGRVDSQTAVALGMTSLKGSQDFIQTLSVTLRQIAGRVPVLIEIKDQDGAMGPNVGRLEAAVAQAVADYTGPAAVMSFNPHSVAAFAALAPDVPRGIVTMDWRKSRPHDIPSDQARALAELEDFDRVGAQFVSCNQHHLDRPVIHDLKAQGIPVLCWTVRSEAQEHLARFIADNITFEGYVAALT